MDVLDRLFELLADERRRYALYYLEQRDGPVPVDELVSRVAEWETDGSDESILDERYEEIEVDFHHEDLPRASEAPYVRYDPGRGLVELTGAPPAVDAILTVARVVERPDRDA